MREPKKAQVEDNSVRRVFMIGLDGATWNVINPLLERGELPAIDRIIKEGVSGKIKSLEFTASPRVWTSIATGKTEDKHGIFDFYNTLDDLRAKRIWDILNQKMKETATIFYWYLTWPPQEKFQDVIVPGFLARDSKTVPKQLSFLKDIELSQKMKIQESYDQTSIFYYVRQAINAIKNGAKIFTIWHALSMMIGQKLIKYNELDLFLKLQLIKYHLHTDVFYHLLKKHPTDFSAIIIPQTDQLGHKFWAFMLPDEFEKKTGIKISNREKKKYGTVIFDIYRKIDQFVGKVCNLMTEDDLLIVLSDHGFGLVTEVSTSLKVKSQQFLKCLDLSDSAHCITLGSNYIIKIDNPEKLPLIDEFAKIIGDISLIKNGDKLFKVKKTEMELVLELQDLFLMKIKDAEHFLQEEIEFNGKRVIAKEILGIRADITGKHEPLGILLMKGKNIKKGKKIQESSVLDIVPTLLYLKGLAIADDMDGTVIKEAIEEKYLSQNKIQTIATYESENQSEPISAVNQSMTKGIEERLKRLGYIN